MLKHINRRGQSTVEYILLVTAVVAVMILFTTNQNTGLQHKLNASLEAATQEIHTISGRLGTSREASPANAASDPPAITTPINEPHVEP